MLAQAGRSDDHTQAIIGASVQGMSENAKLFLPQMETMKRAIRRVRTGHVLPAPRPADRGFVLPDDQKTLLNGELFLQYDNENDAERILIFGTAAAISFLSNSDDWFMDGTFSTAPPQFAQLYTVHGLANGHHVVGLYGLLPNKLRRTYVQFLRQVQRLTNDASPVTIMIDFEQSCIGAIALVFPRTTVFGCLFHLCQSVFRRVQNEGLQELYANNEEFRTNIRMIGALALVELDDVIMAFEALSDHCQGDEQLILDYFETNYIGELRRGRRRRPLFAREL